MSYQNLRAMILGFSGSQVVVCAMFSYIAWSVGWYTWAGVALVAAVGFACVWWGFWRHPT